MSHLGARLTAFVDGELGRFARDRVLAHLAMCAECRAEVDRLRAVKERLLKLPDTEPPGDLIGRLHAMASPPSPFPSSGGTGGFPPGGAGGFPPGGGARRGPGTGGTGGMSSPASRMPSAGYVVAGAVSLAVLGLGAASLATGAAPASLPQVAPAIERLTVPWMQSIQAPAPRLRP